MYSDYWKKKPNTKFNTGCHTHSAVQGHATVYVVTYIDILQLQVTQTAYYYSYIDTAVRQFSLFNTFLLWFSTISEALTAI